MQTCHWRFRWLTLILGMIVGMRGTSASGFISALTKEEIVQSADRIVIGSVAGLVSHWTADRRTIVTDVTIEVQEQFKEPLTRMR